MKTDAYVNNILRIILLAYLSVLGLSSLLMIMGYDQLHYHYLCYRITEWGLLPYRDAYDIQYYGIYLYHLLIQKLFGYGDLGFRIFDLINFIIVCLSLWYFLKKYIPTIRSTSIYLILILFTAGYYGLGWWWTGQREIFQLPYVLWSFYFYKKGVDDGTWYSPLISGLLSGFAFFIKPFAGLYLPLFVIIHFLFNYPYQIPFKIRAKNAVMSGLGFMIMAASFTLYLQWLGILSSFLYDSMQLAVEFKRIGYPFLTNLYYAIFRFDPAVNVFYILLYKIFYALPVVIAVIGILIKIFQKNIRPYFPVIFLFSISFILILVQRNANVTNHHIPLVCFKSIIAVLFLHEWYNALVAFLHKRGFFNEHAGNIISETIIVVTVVFLSVPSFIFGFDEYTRKYLLGKITLQQMQTIKYPLKADEDAVVEYITKKSGIDCNADEILNFDFSEYIAYHSRTRTFNKFTNNAFFVLIPRDSMLYKRFVAELVNDINKKPPMIIIINKKDTTWSTNTCFNNWTTSYDELMKLGNIKMIIQQKFRRVMETKSLVVFQLIK